MGPGTLTARGGKLYAMDNLGDDAAPVTKAELQAFKDDILQRMTIQEGRLRMEMGRIEDRLNANMDARLSETTSQVNYCIGKLEIFELETVRIPKALDKHGKILRGHEERLKGLEGDR